MSRCERLVLARRFGLDGQAPQVLDVLIASLGVTARESVRQIEGQALRRLQLLTQRRALRAKLDQLAQWGEGRQSKRQLAGTSLRSAKALNAHIKA